MLVVPMILYVFVGLPPGIPEWFHVHVWGPLANITTGGHLQEYLFHPSGFAVGAALLYSNAFFRDGHKHIGLFGYVNSWFLGMFFFYLMLNYGLPAAILVHFVYDLAVFTTNALIHAWKKNRL